MDLSQLGLEWICVRTHKVSNWDLFWDAYDYNYGFMIIIMRLLCLMDQLMLWCELVEKLSALGVFMFLTYDFDSFDLDIDYLKLFGGVLLLMLWEVFLYNFFVFWIRFIRLAWELDCLKCSLSCFGLKSLLPIDDYEVVFQIVSMW